MSNSCTYIQINKQENENEGEGERPRTNGDEENSRYELNSSHLTDWSLLVELSIA